MNRDLFYKVHSSLSGDGDETHNPFSGHDGIAPSCDLSEDSNFDDAEESDSSDDTKLARSVEQKLSFGKTRSPASTKTPSKKSTPRTTKSPSNKPSLQGSRNHATDKMEANINKIPEFATVPEPPNFLIFKSLDAAKEGTDFWFDVDVERPECTSPHLVVQIAENQLVEKEFIEVVKITLKQLEDSRDYSSLACWVVCKGRAVVIQTPSVPKWMLDETTHMDSDLNFHHGSDILAASHMTKFNDIARNASRLVQTTLLVFPEDFRLSNGFEWGPVIDGGKVRGIPNEALLDLVPASGGARRTHALRPVSWLFRNIARPRRFLRLEERVKPSDPFEDDKQDGTLFK